MEDGCPPGSGPSCRDHPESPAVAKCVHCNRLLCATCRVFLFGRNYCRSCAASAASQTGGPPQQPGYNPYDYRYYPPAYAPPVYRRQREEIFKGVGWGPGEALLIFFAALALSTGIGLAIYQSLVASSSGTDSRVLFLFFSSVILYALMLFGVYYSVKVRHSSDHHAIGLNLQGTEKGILWGVGLGLPLFVAALALAFVSQFLYNAFYRDILHRSPPTQVMSTLSAQGTSAYAIVLLIFTLVVLAPFCEEIFFRGYFYPSLRNRMGMQAAMLLNGAIFAAVHFDVAGFLPRFLLGYGLCYLYERNRTLAAPMVGHALYNGLLVLLSGIFGLF